MNVFKLCLPVMIACMAALDAQDPVHREFPDQPPVSLEAMPTGRAPAGVYERNGAVSIQVNVDALGNNIVGDAANEPSIAVDPNNHDRMVVGWRQFDSIASNFRQAGWAFSGDGGQTWRFEGLIQAGLFRSDPVLDVDAEGNFYYNSLEGDFNCTVFRSDNGGMSWDFGVPAAGGDKQWMAIDRTDGPGAGNIYSNWTLAFSTCSGDFTFSRDAGQSFEPCINVPTTPRLGTVTVGPEGEVYVVGEGARFARSTTLQDPDVAPGFDLWGNVNLGGGVAVSSGPNPSGMLGQYYVATDHSNGATRGNIYLLASVDPAGSDPVDVMFVRSEDGGNSWSKPVKINSDAPGTNAWQWFGMMSVAPGGRIDVVWNDSRNHPGSFVSELYYSFSDDGGKTWSPNVSVSPSFDPHLGWPQQNKIGDYNDMVSDNLGADVIYAATFNGEQDVYYLRLVPDLAACNGDLNGDNLVDEADLAIALAAWSTETPGDLNGNGVVDMLDLLRLQNGLGGCL